MNNRFAQGSKVAEKELRQLLEKLDMVSGGNLGVNYDIKPTTDALVIIQPEGGSGYEAHAMRFGLWHQWMEDRNWRLPTFNARYETITEKRLFAPLWNAGRRCAVPASGWYEWNGPKGSKRRWHFSLGEPDGLFWFGGLHAASKTHEGDTIRSFSLLTVPANDLVGLYHSTARDPGGRMPVILSHSDVPRWLDPATKADELVRTWPSEDMAVWEVPRQEVGFAQALPIDGSDPH